MTFFELKKIVLLTFLNTLAIQLYAQSPTYKWAFDNTNASYAIRGNTMVVSPGGNTYYTGEFTGTYDFDHGSSVANLTSAGNSDIFVAKYDTEGNYDWALSFGDPGNDYAHVIGIDDNENIIVSGGITGTVDFDPGTGNTSLTGVFYLAKYDSNGNFLWVTPTTYQLYCIKTDAAGNIYITGDNSFAKYDAAGNLIWNINLTGIKGKSITTDATGNVIVSGSFSATVDFDPSASTSNLTAQGLKDGFIAKYDASGNYIWAFALGGTGSSYGGFDEASSIEVDANDNVYVVGIFATTVDFDPGPATHNLTAAFMENKCAYYFAKYDASGNYVFAYKFFSDMSIIFVDVNPDMAIDDNGNIYISGPHWGGNVGTTTTINLTSNGGPDLFVAKYDSNGINDWVFSIGGLYSEFCGTINVDQDDNVYINGYYNPLMDFNPHASYTNNLSSGNYFYAKYGPCIDPDVPTLSATSTTICNGASTVISVDQTDKLNDALVWRLYEGVGGCGTTSFVQENDSGVFIVSPSVNTTYSVRGESGACDPSGPCASINIVVNPVYSVNESTTVCSGESYTFPDGTVQNNITSQVIHNSTLQSINSCDSIIETTVNVYPVYNLTETISICSGAGYTFPDGTTQTNITASLIYTSNLQTIHSCDSIIETTVLINPVYNLIESISLCSGEDYIFPDGTVQTNITSSTTHISNLQTVNSCDSIIETTVNVNPVYFTAESSITICQGDSALIYGNYYSTSGNYYDSLLTTSGCDSVFMTPLIVNPVYLISQNQTICSNDSIFVGGNWQNTAGFYYDTLQTIYGCDSIVETDLTVNLTSNVTIDTSFCEGGSIVLDGTTYTASGTFVHTLMNIFSCDSLVTYNLTVNPLPNAEIGPDTLWVCFGEELAFGIDTSNVASYLISNFFTTVNNDSLLFTYDVSNQPGSVISQVTGNNGCVSSDQVILVNNNINFMAMGLPSLNDPFVSCSIANMPDNVDFWYWSFGDGDTLSGNTDPTHEYLSNGTYTICLIAQNACGTDSSCVTFDINTVGLLSNDIGDQIKIYPNPTTGMVNIDCRNLSDYLIEVYQIDGQLVYSEKVNNNATISKVELSGSPGLYIVRITHNGQSNQYRLAVE